MTLNTCGVPKANVAALVGETESQLPPVVDTAVAPKPNVAPVLATTNVCGSGFAPPNGLVKLSALISLKTAGPTTTLTGTVTLTPGARKSSCPTKVPASSPPPGRLATEIFAVTIEGARPLVA